MLFEQIADLSPVTKYRSLEKRLKSLGRNVAPYKSKSISDVNYAIKISESKINKIIENNDFNSYFKDENYVVERLTLDALSLIKTIKEDNERNETLIPGYTYYRCKAHNGKVVGKKCYFINESKAFWVKVNEDERLLKVLELLEHGSEEDFKKLYVELADGSPFKAVREFTLEHITKSSSKALSEMAAYCDTRWSGKWPWNIRASNKIEKVIKENQQMVKNSMKSLKESFIKNRRRLNEGEIEKSEIRLKFKGMNDDLVSMIEKLGKISGELLTDDRDKIRTEFGEQHLSALDHIAKEQITQTVDAISALKAAIDQQVQSMEGGGDQKPEFDDPSKPSIGSSMMQGDDGEFDDDMQDGSDQEMGSSEMNMSNNEDSEFDDEDINLDDELGLGDEDEDADEGERKKK